VPGEARSSVSISLEATAEIEIAMGVFFRSDEANLNRETRPRLCCRTLSNVSSSTAHLVPSCDK
jgi:hypothetical protein